MLPFWGLVRADLRGLPIVLLPGSQYVTQTSTRRNTGAQYTTKALAEEVVQYALEPLVYDPGPQNEADPEKWQLRTPAELLDLRICDPAVGSGAILTEVLAAAKRLAERGIACDVVSVTSWSELARDGMACEKTTASVPHVTRLLQGSRGPVIAASDYVRAVPESIRAFIPAGRRYLTLGTDGFGRSDTRAALREFFGVDAASIARAARAALGAA